MKCPKCSSNHRYSMGMKCACGYQFLLDPKIDLISDVKMGILVDKISNENQNYFTIDQVYYLFRRQFFKPVSCLLPAVIIAIVINIIYYFAEGFELSLVLISLGALIVIFVILKIAKQTNKQFNETHDNHKFHGKFNKWNSFNKIDKVITKTEMDSPPPNWQEKDIYDYGVNAIVIVDEKIMVDCMIKNELHITNHCLILSECGYPSYLMGIAQELKEKSPDMPVYYFHRFDPNRARQNEPLDDNRWNFLKGHYIDIGLNENSVEELKVIKDLQFGDKEVIPLSALPANFFAKGFSLILAGELVSLTDVAITGVAAASLNQFDFG